MQRIYLSGRMGAGLTVRGGNDRKGRDQMMKRQKIRKVTAAVVAAAMLISGCQGGRAGQNGQGGSSGTDGSADEELYGQVTVVDESEIMVSLAKRPEGPVEETEFTGEEQTVKVTEETKVTRGGGMKGAPGKPEGQEGEAPEKPEGQEGEVPEKPENQEGEAPEKPEGQEGEDGEQPRKPGGGAEEAELSDMQKGDMVRIILNGDEAAEIMIQSMPEDAGKKEESVAELTGTYTVDGEKESAANKTYESEEQDKSAVLVTNQGSLKLTGGTLKKTGDTGSTEQSDFYGLNAVFAVEDGSRAELYDSTVSSSAEGANAVFATGEDSEVSIDNIRIHTTGNSSRGLDATYGGSITATNVDIKTEGAHCAPAATDRGEGTITVNGGTLSASGEGSPCVYSTGDITIKNVEGEALASQAAVVEGKNSVTLEKCKLTGSGENGVMLYQSTSGDAGEGTASFTARDCELSSSSKGPMFYVTNTKAEALLDNTALNFGGGILAQVSGNDTNNWGKPGANGGDFTLTAAGQKLAGDITCDSISTVSVVLTDKSQWTGALNAGQEGKKVSVSLDVGSSWTLTGDSYVDVFENKDESLDNIISNGYMIYYDPAEEANDWLEKRTINLSGGGKIMPK